MKLSTKSRYGVRALFDIAYHGGRGAVQIKDIARRQAISSRYLEQIFISLKQAGLLRSQRGPQGGYTLTRTAEEITVAEIVTATEGEIALVACAGKGNTHEVCHLYAECVTRRLWEESSALLTEYFSSITLRDLCRDGENLGLDRELGAGGIFYI